MFDLNINNIVLLIDRYNENLLTSSYNLFEEEYIFNDLIVKKDSGFRYANFSITIFNLSKVKN